MTEPLVYFSQQGHISDPGCAAAALNNLPTGLPELAELVRNVTVHVFWAGRYGLTVTPDRMPELQLRTIERRLSRTLALDPRPLTELRPPEKKLLGNCRDHSVLLAALLRHQGIPARARCGFGAYFLPDHFEDHWVTEYWHQSEARWVLVDAQLDALQSETLKIGFDPFDVPRNQFIMGGQAWQLCRSGQRNPDRFGIFDMHGLGFVRGNLVRDVAALNKMELLPWDCWGVILTETLDDPADLAALDQAAAMTAGDVPDAEAVHQLYHADPRFRVSSAILSYVDGEMVPVALLPSKSQETVAESAGVNRPKS